MLLAQIAAAKCDPAPNINDDNDFFKLDQPRHRKLLHPFHDHGLQSHNYDRRDGLAPFADAGGPAELLHHMASCEPRRHLPVRGK
jgi:hypothetical protein